MPIHEGLCPKPGAKQTTKKRENQFHEDVMGPTSEVVEPPAQFEYTRGYEHMDCQQPMLQVLPTEQIMSHEYYTWPAGTWVSIPQTENQFHEDPNMNLASHGITLPRSQSLI